MKTNISASDAPPATGPFSHAIATGGFIFTAGQIHLNTEGKLVGESTEEKAHQVMKNLGAILKEAGATFADVVKTTIYITDMTAYGKVSEVYGSYMSDPYPARETVCVKELPLGAEVEISMIAVKP